MEEPSTLHQDTLSKKDQSAGTARCLWVLNGTRRDNSTSDPVTAKNPKGTLHTLLLSSWAFSGRLLIPVVLIQALEERLA